MKKHTKETYFKIVGYSERWEDPKLKNRMVATTAVTHGGEKREKNTSSRKSNQWTFYCGATETMTHDPHDFDSLSTHVKTHIETASGELIAVQGGGSIVFSEKLKLKNYLYVPVLSSKLLSVSQVTKELNCVVLMFSNFCILHDILKKEIIGRGTEREGLYYIDEVVQKGHVMLAHGTVTRQLWLWHRCLGHPSFGYLKILFPSLFTSNTKSIKCETCIRAKNYRVTFSLNNNRVNSAFSLVHSDVWGPAPNSHNNQFQYFVLFVDDFSRMTWVYFLKHKFEVPDKFYAFYQMIHTQFDKKIQVLRSDNGGEFVNKSMQEFFRENGLINQTSCPNTPQ